MPGAPSTQLFPEVVDASSLGAKISSSLFLPIAIEGQAGSDGNCVINTEYAIQTPNDAVTIFGATSPLTNLILFLLGRGVNPVIAVASIKGASTPTLLQREAAWAVLESDYLVRIRLTDDTSQATLAGLAASCDNANLLNNKQIAFGGLLAGTQKPQIISANKALNHKRLVLVSPGIIDLNNATQSGAYSAAVAAADVALNSDISDDLNLDTLVNLTGIELNAQGQPLFLERVISGVVVNDFEDVLQAGGSPLMTDRSGLGVRITHLRMTWTGATPGTDSSYDALMTRLIVDQVFLDVKGYCYDNNFLQKGNTQKNRDALQAGVEALLEARSTWIDPILQPDGTTGYGVTVIPSPDQRQVTIQYQGTVIRGIATIQVDAQLVIPV